MLLGVHLYKVFMWTATNRHSTSSVIKFLSICISEPFLIHLAVCTIDSHLNTRMAHFITNKADCATFTNLAVISRNMVNGNIDSFISKVTNVIINAASTSFPKSFSHRRKHSKPWWTEDCK